ncbi:MAG: hypothetical protein HY909_13430 [Deltaproteobacteria bacterium]|nr:hypothetical protein [Deltaproteobacteria bacterium]
MKRWIVTAAVLCAALGAGGAASAQNAGTEAPSPAPGTQPPSAEAAGSRLEGGRRVYTSTVIVVTGEIQRPYAFSVSSRSSLGYTYFDAPISFLREILDAVRRAPF